MLQESAVPRLRGCRQIALQLRNGPEILREPGVRKNSVSLLFFYKGILLYAQIIESLLYLVPGSGKAGQVLARSSHRCTYEIAACSGAWMDAMPFQ